MQTPEYVGSSAARMIAAVAVFLGLAVVGVWFVSSRAPTDANGLPAEAKVSQPSKPVKGKPADSGPFFYRAIGTTPEGEAAAPQDQHLSYTLEIKVAKNREEAEALIDELAAKGVEAYYTPLSRKGQVVYRVRRGMFTSQKAAAAASVALKDQHQLAARVVKLQ